MLTVRKEQKFLIIDDCRRLRKRKKARWVGFQRGVAMKRMILVCCLCFAATSVYAERIEEHWIVDKTTGCQALTFKAPSSDLSISWSGKCKDGKVNGNGVLKFYKKDKLSIIIEGMMNNGQCLHGCSFETANGTKYVGDLYNGAIHGNGITVWPDGEKYSGQFKNFSRDGNGKMVYSTNNANNYMEYQGGWKENNPHGTGTMLYKNGDKYSGAWSEGKQHGKGTYTFKDGTSYEGLWEHGERIKIF